MNDYAGKDAIPVKGGGVTDDEGGQTFDTRVYVRLKAKHEALEKRCRELEAIEFESTQVKRALVSECARQREAIENAPCPLAVTPYMYPPNNQLMCDNCGCWKYEALKDRDK